MENKATLARATKELKRLQEELIHASAEAEEFSFSINTKIQNEKQVMRNEFEQRKQEVKNNISIVVLLKYPKSHKFWRKIIY